MCRFYWAPGLRLEMSSRLWQSQKAVPCTHHQLPIGASGVPLWKLAGGLLLYAKRLGSSFLFLIRAIGHLGSQKREVVKAEVATVAGLVHNQGNHPGPSAIQRPMGVVVDRKVTSFLKGGRLGMTPEEGALLMENKT